MKPLTAMALTVRALEKQEGLEAGLKAWRRGERPVRPLEELRREARAAWDHLAVEAEQAGSRILLNGELERATA